MEFNDVMTLEEAAERWKKTSDALRQNCLGGLKTDSGKGSIENQAESGWLHGQGWNEYMGKR